MFTIKFFQLFWIFEIFHSMKFSIDFGKKNFWYDKKHILKFFWNKVYMSPQVYVLEICNQLILEYSRADCPIYGILFSVNEKFQGTVRFNVVSNIDIFDWENTNHKRLQRCFYEVRCFLFIQSKPV